MSKAKFALITIILVAAGAAGYLFLVPARPAEAASLNWIHDYSEALKRARVQQRQIVAYLHTDWCGYCQEMDQKTFTDRNLIKTLGNRFVWLKLNAETNPQGVQLKERFHVSGYPTIVLLNEEGSEIDRLEGYAPAAAFEARLVKMATSKETFGVLKKQAADQPDSPAAQFRLADKYLDRKNFKKAQEGFEKVIQLDPDNQAGKTDASYYWLALSLVYQDKTADALTRLASLDNRFPKSRWQPDASLLKGQILYFSGHQEEARKVLKAYLIKYPKHPFAKQVSRMLDDMEKETQVVSSH